MEIESEQTASENDNYDAAGRVTELEMEKKRIQDEFNVQRAKMKDLFLQKENELARKNEENSALSAEIAGLKRELDDLKSQVVVAGITHENVFAQEKRKANEEIASLQQLVHDEGRQPIFAREDIVVNIHKAYKEPTLSEAPNARREKSKSKERPREAYRGRSRSRSPIPHTSREGGSRNHEYYSSRNRRSPSPRNKESRRYSKSPGRYEKRRSRSRSARGGPSERYRSRSPYRHRVIERERRRTRSRTRSPYRSRSRGRHSRSPRRDYRHERSQRSRSQRRHTRYSPGRRRTRSKSPPRRMPEYVYYQGDEYWIPQPMPPRFRGYLPPGPYPRAMPPGPVIMPRIPLAPMMIPPHPVPFRQRLPVYNTRPMPKLGAATATTTTVTTTQGDTHSSR